MSGKQSAQKRSHNIIPVVVFNRLHFTDREYYPTTTTTSTTTSADVDADMSPSTPQHNVELSPGVIHEIWLTRNTQVEVRIVGSCSLAETASLCIWMKPSSTERTFVSYILPPHFVYLPINTSRLPNRTFTCDDFLYVHNKYYTIYRIVIIIIFIAVIFNYRHHNHYTDLSRFVYNWDTTPFIDLYTTICCDNYFGGR
jgi:hypothetical protein